MTARASFASLSETACHEIDRDGNLVEAMQYAEATVRDSEDLIQSLGQMENYTAAQAFAGMAGLANEIGSKKISSEEETYSDQSILIYYHNTQGMFNLWLPFEPLLQSTNASLAMVSSTSIR